MRACRDYAGKHWQGLISDYYVARIQTMLGLAVTNAHQQQPFNQTAATILQIQLAYNWTRARNPYPVTPLGDAVEVAQLMFNKYAPRFAACRME